MTGVTPAGGITFFVASSILIWLGEMLSGSGTCLTVTTMSIDGNSIRALEGVGDELRDVLDREGLLDVERAHAVFEHGHAERAAHGHAAGIRANRFVQPVVRNARAALFFHERPRAAGAAAEA